MGNYKNKQAKKITATQILTVSLITAAGTHSDPAAVCLNKSNMEIPHLKASAANTTKHLWSPRLDTSELFLYYLMDQVVLEYPR